MVRRWLFGFATAVLTVTLTGCWCWSFSGWKWGTQSVVYRVHLGTIPFSWVSPISAAAQTWSGEAGGFITFSDGGAASRAEFRADGENSLFMSLLPINVVGRTRAAVLNGQTCLVYESDTAFDTSRNWFPPTDLSVYRTWDVQSVALHVVLVGEQASSVRAH